MFYQHNSQYVSNAQINSNDFCCHHRYSFEVIISDEEGLCSFFLSFVVFNSLEMILHERKYIDQFIAHLRLRYQYCRYFISITAQPPTLHSNIH